MVAAHPLPDAPIAVTDGARTPAQRLRELGLDGEIVLSTSNPDELEAYLDATEPARCASST
ncbi:MAG: hypothetical protein QM820_56895 [Minicystis sp.]